MVHRFITVRNAPTPLLHTDESTIGNGSYKTGGESGNSRMDWSIHRGLWKGNSPLGRGAEAREMEALSIPPRELATKEREKFKPSFGLKKARLPPDLQQMSDTLDLWNGQLNSSDHWLLLDFSKRKPEHQNVLFYIFLFLTKIHDSSFCMVIFKVFEFSRRKWRFLYNPTFVVVEFSRQKCRFFKSTLGAKIERKVASVFTRPLKMKGWKETKIEKKEESQKEVSCVKDQSFR